MASEASPSFHWKIMTMTVANTNVTTSRIAGSTLLVTAFPTLVEGKQASWSKDGLTCTLSVALEPDREYELGLNSLSHNNFQSQSGVPLPPVLYTFRTRSAK